MGCGFRTHLIWVLGNPAQFRWRNGWCPRCPLTRRVAGGADTATARCWPRSSSWPAAAAPGPNSRRCSAPPGHPALAFHRVGPETGWVKLCRLVLDELGSRSELDWSWRAIDPVNMCALKGVRTGPDPVDRGTKGSKIHLITVRTRSAARLRPRGIAVLVLGGAGPPPVCTGDRSAGSLTKEARVRPGPPGTRLSPWPGGLRFSTGSARRGRAKRRFPN